MTGLTAVSGLYLWTGCFLLLSLLWRPNFRRFFCLFWIGFLLGAISLQHYLISQQRFYDQWLSTKPAATYQLKITNSSPTFRYGRAVFNAKIISGVAEGCPIRLFIPPEGEIFPQYAKGDRLEVWATRSKRFKPNINPPFNLYVKSNLLIEKLRPHTKHVDSPAGHWHKFIKSRLKQAAGWSEENIALGTAMMVGDRSGLEEEQWTLFRSIGLAHLLAISGFHFSACWGLLWLGSRFSLRGRLLGRACFGLAVVLWILAILPTPAPWRASLCALWVSLAQVQGRKTFGVHGLALMAVLLLVIQPGWFFNIGFQLSFVAAGALSLHAKLLMQWCRFGGLLMQGMGVSALAVLVTSPLTATYFKTISVSSIVSTPLATPLTFGSILSCVWTIFRPEDGHSTQVMLNLWIHWLEMLQGWLPPPSAAAPPHPVICSCLLFILFTPLKFGSERLRWFLLSIWFLLTLCGQPSRLHKHQAIFEAIDVGQGQAIQWLTRDSVITLDTGSRWGERSTQNSLIQRNLRRGVRRIDALVITHGDEDHAGGATQLMQQFDIGELWVPISYSSDPRLQKIVQAAVHQNIGVRALRTGDQITLNAEWSVWHPSQTDIHRTSNQSGLVLSLRWHSFSAFIQGDVEAEGERVMVEREQLPQVDVWIIGHHGSKHATHMETVHELAAKEAWISSGRWNRFGHPHPSVIDKLQSKGVRVRRTDHEGTIQWIISQTGF